MNRVAAAGVFFLFLIVAVAEPVTTDKPLLVTVQKMADALGIIDPDSGKLVSQISVGRKPHEFAISKDGKLALVTNYGADTYTETHLGGNTVTLIDLVNRKPLANIDLADHHRPHGIERGRSGLFYITTEMPATLLVVDANKRKILHAIPLLGKLTHMVQVSEDERRAWTADAGSGSVTEVDLSAHKSVRKIEIGGVPMGFALTREEKTLYASTRTANRIAVIDTGSGTVQRQIEVPGEPARLLLTADGKYLITSLIIGGEAAVIDTATQKELRRVPCGKRPEGLTFAPDGQSFYVSAQMENNVYRFSIPDLKPMGVIAVPGKPDPLTFWTPGTGPAGH